MKINPVNNQPLPQPQQTFRGRGLNNFVQVVTEKAPVTQYCRDFVLPQASKLEQIASKYGKPVRIAQLADEKLLVNVGTVSNVLDVKKLRVTDIPAAIINVIKGNAIAEERGVKKGLEYIELNSPEVVGSRLNILG